MWLCVYITYIPSHWLQAVMQKLQPMKLYGVQFFYNIAQMALCSYMCIEAGMQAYRSVSITLAYPSHYHHVSWGEKKIASKHLTNIYPLLVTLTQGYTLLPCEPYNATKPPIGAVLWFFYVSKILDFADTVFIILGKKWKQLSFLHVYHHVTIFLVSSTKKKQMPQDCCVGWPEGCLPTPSSPNQVYWLNLNAGYDGDTYLTVILNGAVHTIMYTYYFLSMHTKDIWWKRYLTLFQIIQFLTMNAQVSKHWLWRKQGLSFWRTTISCANSFFLVAFDSLIPLCSNCPCYYSHCHTGYLHAIHWLQVLLSSNHQIVPHLHPQFVGLIP